MARTRDLQFGNFICKMGPHINMLAMGEWLVSIFREGNERTRGHGNKRTRWLFRDPRVVDLGNEVYGIAFEFVKDWTFTSEQHIDPDTNEMVVGKTVTPTSPSALCLLVLNTHWLAYLPKTAYAPTMQELAATCEHLLRQVRNKAIAEEARAQPHGERSKKRSELERSLPPPKVEIVPLASGEALNDVISKFKTIRSFTVRVFAPNPSNYKVGGELFDILDAQRDAAAASSSELTYRGSDLKKELVREEAAAIVNNPNANLRITGSDEEGNSLKQTKASVSLRQPPDFEAGRAPEIAPDMYRAIQKVTAMYKVVDEGQEHAAAIAAKAKALYDKFSNWFD